ncbi:MAG: choice-of-anchor U domain-containing protein, partial [Methylobacter sp.]|nr:choice-of-anchor U domain-containing protein [Methylobacter sp.]
APAYQSAAVNGSTLTLAYDEALKADGLPEASTFTLKVNEAVVTNGITSVAINADTQKLDLTLDNPVFFGQKVTISYADPTTGNDASAIQDAAGNDAVSFVDYGVTNNTAATSSVVIDTQLTGEKVTLSVGGGLSINQATNTVAPTNLGKSIKMPLGEFGFNLTGLQNGGKAQLSMTADADLKQLTYYKWNYLTNKYDNIAKTVSIDTVTNKATVFFELVDGGAYDADRVANGTIVDPGGVAENKLLPVILENETAVGLVSALNPDQVNGTISYAITGGDDQAKFSINSSTGALAFLQAPDFETPTDEGDTAGNNTYAVTVTVSGSNGGSEIQPLIVTVMNVPEAGDPTVGSNVTATEGTVTVTPAPSATSTIALINFNDPTTGDELWKTDATTGGTVLVKDINPGMDSSMPQGFADLGNGKSVFSADDGTHGRELWVTDGTEAGTSLVKDINAAPTTSYLAGITPLGNGKAVFSANDGTHGFELWVTDGTAAGTTLLKDINLGSVNSSPAWFVSLGNGKVLFRATDSTHGSELWVTDGTEAGTLLVKDINAGSNFSTPQELVSLGNGKVVFSAADTASNTELWVSDGTGAGTLLVKDINAGPTTSFPSGFVSLGNGKVVFSADDGTHGAELWVTDGTANGTVLVKDINGTNTGSSIASILSLGNGQAIFQAIDPTNGAAMWVTDGTEAG